MDRQSVTLNSVFVLTKIIVMLTLAVAIGVGATIGWRWYSDNSATADEDGVIRARIIRATMFSRNELRVGRLSGVVQGRGQASRLWGWLPSSQVIKAPFSVDYFVDMGRIKSSDMVMSDDGRGLLVTVPDVYPDKPNIDMANVSMNNLRGWFVSRSATAELARKAAGSARAEAESRSRLPENINKSREFARTALKRFIENALSAAKVNVVVEVRFAGEQPPYTSRWDVSRSIEEVMKGITAR